MFENDLNAIWQVLETQASGQESLIKVQSSGVSIRAGEVLLGVDNEGHRHVLIPLQENETFAEDRNGRSIHVGKVLYESTYYLSAECLQRDLDSVFVQFVRELLGDLINAASPPLSVIESLEKWRNLFSIGQSNLPLSEPQTIGLLAELMVLERILQMDGRRKVEVWTGPSGSHHDFRNGSLAIEVKATMNREGRIVPITSVEQLHEPHDGRLYLAHHRFEKDSNGLSIPDMVKRILALGVSSRNFIQYLSEVGYLFKDQDKFDERKYRLIEVRYYDVLGEAFPRIIPNSFKSGATPSGTLRISYSIDLSNEPPHPLSETLVEPLLLRVAAGK